jgi:hypothetical protein
MGDDGGGSPSGRGLMFLACFVLLFFSFPYYHSFVRGETCAQRTAEGGFLACFVLLFFSFPYSSLFCKGSSYPETCAQRTAEDGGFSMW